MVLAFDIVQEWQKDQIRNAETMILWRHVPERRALVGERTVSHQNVMASALHQIKSDDLPPWSKNYYKIDFNVYNDIEIWVIGQTTSTKNVSTYVSTSLQHISGIGPTETLYDFNRHGQSKPCTIRTLHKIQRPSLPFINNGGTS